MRFLILDTSDRVGQVAVASGPQVLAVRRLDETRRHARDLAPAVKEFLSAQGWKAHDLTAVIVGRGPGSYTGLRVGIMSAKALAYATGCALIAVDTFRVLAAQVGDMHSRVDVLADAQGDKVYVQCFGRTGDDWQPVNELAIRPFAEWLTDRVTDAAVTGPGLRKWAERFPADVAILDQRGWEVQMEVLLRLGLARFEAGERDDAFQIEPLYLRPSAAEEQWRGRDRNSYLC